MKKKLLTASLICFLIAGIASLGIAKDGDIPKSEVRPDVAEYVLDTLVIRYITETATVTYRKVDADGNPVGEEVTAFFRNILDDPETVEDETDMQFDDLKANIKISDKDLGDKVKIKLGIE